ncbi:DUF6916 family protein [Caulobacter sp. LARHSG274]
MTLTAEPAALTADLFARHVGQAFRIQGGWHVLTLNQVDRPPPQPWHQDMGLTPFTLLFSGPPGDVLAEGLHTIVPEDGTAYGLYLIPVHTPAAGRQDYQAVFN